MEEGVRNMFQLLLARSGFDDVIVSWTMYPLHQPPLEGQSSRGGAPLVFSASSFSFELEWAGKAETRMDEGKKKKNKIGIDRNISGRNG